MDGDQRSLTRAARKRGDVLRAARQRFIRDGYAGAGMEGVARDAGVSTATLYSYFPGKADLFREVIMETADHITQRLEEIEREDGSAAEQLTRYAAAYGRFWADPYFRGMFRLLTSERKRFEATADKFHEIAKTGWGGALMRILRRLVAVGELSLNEPATAAGQLLGMMEHPTLIYGLVAGEQVETERPIESIAAEAVKTFMARYGQG